MFSQAIVNGYFAMLDHSLRTFPLPNADGSRRYASADEFMLMRVSAGVAYFKHRDTRNYLMMDGRTGALSIPVGGLFMAGTFDRFNPVAAAVWFRQALKSKARG